MRQTEVKSTPQDRSVMEETRSKDSHHSREVNRAHLLSCLDHGVPGAPIMAVWGIGRTGVWRTRLAYLQGRVKLAPWRSFKSVSSYANASIAGSPMGNVCDRRWLPGSVAEIPSDAASSGSLPGSMQIENSGIVVFRHLRFGLLDV